MKALILNSGMGKRMGEYTKEHPKCMTQISENGDTILSRQLQIISKYGIKDVVITTGLFENVLIDYCNSLKDKLNIKFVNNPDYDKTNYIYSIYKAKDILDDDIILMHGDLVFAKEVFEQVLNSKESCMIVSSTKELPEKDFKAVIKKDKEGHELIQKVGIEFFESAKAAQPLYKINKLEWKKWLDKIIEFCESGDRSCYAENALNALDGKCYICAMDIENDLCEEIDTPEDYKRVYEMINQRK